MTVAPIMEPDAAAVRRHLEHVFASARGLIELSWTDARTGALACAEQRHREHARDARDGVVDTGCSTGVPIIH